MTISKAPKAVTQFNAWKIGFSVVKTLWISPFILKPALEKRARCLKTWSNEHFCPARGIHKVPIPGWKQSLLSSLSLHLTMDENTKSLRGHNKNYALLKATNLNIFILWDCNTTGTWHFHTSKGNISIYTELNNTVHKAFWDWKKCSRKHKNNPRMVWVKRDLRDHPVPSSLPWAGTYSSSPGYFQPF